MPRINLDIKGSFSNYKWFRTQNKSSFKMSQKLVTIFSKFHDTTIMRYINDLTTAF